MISVCHSIMMWKKAYELLYIFFLQYDQFFNDWSAMALLNINRNCSSCSGTTNMSLIFSDWICSVIIKNTMELAPWTLITYSAYVLISWTLAIGYSLHGMWCNSKPLSINALPCFYSGLFSTDTICFALWADVTAGFSLCSESTCIHLASARSLLAQLHWKSLWSKRDGGYEHSS